MACVQTDAQILIFLLRKGLYLAWLYHKARSNSRENYYCFKDTDFIFGPLYKLSKFHVFYANDS